MGLVDNLGGGSYGLVRGESSFRVDQVGCEDGVDEGGLSETGLTLSLQC